MLRGENVVGINTVEYIRQVELVMNEATQNPDGVVKAMLSHHHFSIEATMKLSESMSNNNIEYKVKVLKKGVFKDAVDEFEHKSEVMERWDAVFGKVATYIFNSQYLGDGGFNTKAYGKDVQAALMNKSAAAAAEAARVAAAAEAAAPGAEGDMGE